MYVCVCNAITESRLSETARGLGHRSPREAYRALGCQVDCGRCLRAAADVMHGARATAIPAE